jgi:hypothetical protein
MEVRHGQPEMIVVSTNHPSATSLTLASPETDYAPDCQTLPGSITP